MSAQQSHSFRVAPRPLLTFALIGAFAFSLLPHPVAAATATTTALSVTPDPSYVDETVTMTATVTPLPDGGSIDFYRVEGGVETDLLSTVAVDVSTGVASWTTTLPEGTDSFAANFSGTDAFSASQSATVSHVSQLRPTTTSLSVSPDGNVVEDSGYVLTATVSPNPGPLDVAFYGYDDENPLGTARIDAETGVATYDTGPLSPGTYSFQAVFNSTAVYAASGSAVITRTVLRATETSLSLSRSSLVVGQSLSMTATVVPTPSGGTVAFTATSGTTTIAIGSDDPDSSGHATLSTSSLPVGTWTIEAAYSGSDSYASSSDTASVSVLADTTVQVTNVHITYSTFYPVKDDYRDTVSVKGSLQEKATTSVAVHSSTGHVVRRLALSARTGAFSLTWNGRNSNGTLVKEGKYRLALKVTDMHGNTKRFSLYTTVSKMKLIWKSGTKTRYADTFDDGVATGSAWGSTGSDSDFARGLLLYGGHYSGDGVLALYQWRLPSAVKYGKLRFSAHGKVPRSGFGPALLSFYNTSTGEADGVKLAGSSYDWYGTTVRSSHHRSGRKVYTFVSAHSANHGYWDFSSVKLHYRYAVLGY